MPNLADLLIRSAVERPDQVAIKLDDAELSYAALDEAAARAAGLLRAKGVRPGDRVAIMLPNVTYFPICYYGALRAGAAVVPVNGMLKEREVAFHLGDSEAKVLLAWHEFADAAQAGAEQTDTDCVLVQPGEFEALLERFQPIPEVAERRRDDTAVILYHSGTTDTAKGAELTHDNLLRRRRRHRGPLRARRALGDARGAAVLSRLRPDLRAQRDRRRGRVSDANSAL